MGLRRDRRMRRADFRHPIATRGRRVVTGPLVLHVLHQHDDTGDSTSAERDRGAQGHRRPAPPPVRVGFAIGRRVGPSVVRNRLRRRLREASAEVLEDRDRSGLGPGPGALVLIRAMPGAERLDVPRMTALLAAGLSRADRPRPDTRRGVRR
jgi:ribonuclease P protein component